MQFPRLMTIACSAVLAVALQVGAARAELKKQWIDYKEGATPLYGYLVYDDAFIGKRPGVLMAHNRAGMSEVIIRDSDMVAKMGYVVFAADIFGKGILPKDVPAMTEQTTIYNKDRPLMR
jgi:dienelactone hydrolase